uniref:Ig-like domain-containing protein n=1 Tax=Cyprinus carpio carpio TaxID=630221 RepID=A0A9J8BQS2_CYPCA
MKRKTEKEKMSECHLCLLGLIALSSLLTGASGVDDAHVFISSGENVRLPCNNALPDCKSTTWIYNRFSRSGTDELIGLGKKKDTQRHERLSLGSDCSLNINNISTEDYGSYICQQWSGVNGPKQRTDARVYLHVLQVSQTEISAGLSVTLFCQLYSYPRVSCDDWIRSERIQLFWVNQAGVKLNISDSRYQISSSSDPCIITLNITLLNEDHNREWRCNVTQRDQLKTSVTYTVKSSAPDKTMTAVTTSQHPSTTTTHKTTDPDKTMTAVTTSQHPSTTTTHKTTDPAKTMTAVINSQHPSTTNTHKTTDPAKSTTAMTPVHNTNSTTNTPVTSTLVIVISAAAASAVFLAAVLWLICRKRAGNKRETDESVVKDENEDKVTYETINMSTPAAARDNEQTDDVTYSEVSCSSKNPVKSLKVSRQQLILLFCITDCCSEKSTAASLVYTLLRCSSESESQINEALSTCGCGSNTDGETLCCSFRIKMIQ